MGNNRIIKAVLPRMISLLLILCTLTSNLAGGIVFAITGEEYTHDASCGYAEDGICTCADAESQGSLSDSEELTLISPGSDSSVSFMSTASGDSEAGVTATLYSTGSDTGTPVVFTADGWTTVDGEPVELSQSLSRGKNLMKIKWVFNCSTAHTLSISVPAGIYIDNGTWSSVGQQGSLLTNVSFTTLDIDSGTKNPQQGVGT